ncbi:MAG: hypothetical protein WCF88_14220, partial [Candidatus Acidiferrales bacterium]
CPVGTKGFRSGVHKLIQPIFSRRVSKPCVKLPGKHRIFNALSARKYQFLVKPGQSMIYCMPDPASI